MSQRKVKGEWVPEGPASVAASDVMAMHANGGMLGGSSMGPSGGAGPVERRQATADELAAARAREVEPAVLPRYVVVGSRTTGPTPAQAARARERGGEANRQRNAALSTPDPHPWSAEANLPPRTAASYQRRPSPPEEEPAVSQEPAHIVSTESAPDGQREEGHDWVPGVRHRGFCPNPRDHATADCPDPFAEPEPDEPPVALDRARLSDPALTRPLEQLAAAATAASEASDRKQAADYAWDIAREALESAMGAVMAIVWPDLADDPAREPSEAEARHEQLLEDPIRIERDEAWRTASPEREVMRISGGGIDPEFDYEEVETTEDESPTARMARLAQEAAERAEGAEPGPEPEPVATGGTVRTWAGPNALSRNQRRVLERTIALDGDYSAVARELGQRVGNVGAVLEAIGKKKLLPIALIAKLPARFAKYRGV